MYLDREVYSGVNRTLKLGELEGPSFMQHKSD